MIQSWILASGSPRRKEILASFGIPFTVFSTDVDESSEETDATKLSEELSLRKGRAAVEELKRAGKYEENQMVIASDTTVFIDKEILGKPKDEADALRMLSLLQGRRHKVVSGIFLGMNGKEAVSHEVTEVEFAPMTKAEMNAYIATGEPFGKAGAYAIQGIGSKWARGIHGDFYNVVGLPVGRMWNLLMEAYGEDFLNYVHHK